MSLLGKWCRYKTGTISTFILPLRFFFVICRSMTSALTSTGLSWIPLWLFGPGTSTLNTVNAGVTYFSRNTDHDNTWNPHLNRAEYAFRPPERTTIPLSEVHVETTN